MRLPEICSSTSAYLNPVPVDVLRKLSRVESTIVVDVEDEHYAAFRSLTARDGGLGGWRLLWERVSPFARGRKALAVNQEW